MSSGTLTFLYKPNFVELQLFVRPPFNSSTCKSAEIETSLLVIVLDVNPMQRIVKQETKILSQCLDSTIVFANAHLMQSSNNELAVMACHGYSARFLYPCENVAEIRQMDGQYEKFTMVERTVRQQLQQVINEIPLDVPLYTESLISGALSMALCYIARLEREKVAGQKLHPRILVITASNDSATQYMNYMNIFFTAQRMVFVSIGFLCYYNNRLTMICDATRSVCLLPECYFGCVQPGSGADTLAAGLRHYRW